MWLEPGEEKSMGMGVIKEEDTEQGIKDRLISFIEQRIATLELEILEENPELAKKLKIE